MLGTLNIASYGFLVGAFGQFWFYVRLFSHTSEWLLLGVLLIPWLALFTITFCKQSPFGPRPFRFCLTLVMCSYALLTVLAEILQQFHPLPSDGFFSITLARILMYIAFLSFIPLGRSYILLRRPEPKQGACREQRSEPPPPRA